MQILTKPRPRNFGGKIVEKKGCAQKIILIQSAQILSFHQTMNLRL